MADDYEPLDDMWDSIAKQVQDNQAELSAFRQNLGLDQPPSEPDCPPIELGTLVSGFELEKPLDSEKLSDGSALCDDPSRIDPAFPGSLRYTQRFTFYVPLQKRVAITLEAPIPPSLALARLGRDSELLGSDSIEWKPNRQGLQGV